MPSQLIRRAPQAKAMRVITLVEYKTETGVPLSAKERDDLRSSPAKIGVAPSIGREGFYDLTPSSWIGAINLGTLAVDIRPKIPIDRVVFLISYALDPQRWQRAPFDLGQERSLLEAVIPAFVAHVRRALARGVLQGYRTEQEALATVRGRVRFDDQLRDRFGIFPPVEVRYDEFTEDVDVNRLIKAAIIRLGKMQIRSAPARASLRAFNSALATVQAVQYDPRRLPDIAYTRLNEHYRPAVELAKLILCATSFELHHGDVRASAFLVDMNAVFERFVVVALRDHLRLSERTFPQGAAGRHLRLDQAGSIELLPDLSWWEGQCCTFVGDVKYKQTDAAGEPNADVYQLLAYTIATNLPGGLLIYAAGEAKATSHQIVHVGKAIEVATLDLRGTPGAILGQVAIVAGQIERLRRRAVGAAVA